uniref:Uncharacterized protein n=1 Tax=Aegilops tauschii TaxID=37682 RepID=R7WCM1_AEGTA
MARGSLVPGDVSIHSYIQHAVHKATPYMQATIRGLTILCATVHTLYDMSEFDDWPVGLVVDLGVDGELHVLVN